MTSPRFSLALAVLGSACLPAHDQAALPLSAEARLELRDARGSLWPGHAMPRSPRLRLWFDAPALSATTVRAWLVDGPVADVTLADLSSSTVAERTRARLVPLSFELGERYVELTPRAALAAARDYSLVFASQAGPVVRALRTSGDPGAGAALIGSLPPPGAESVPPSQADLLWLFDGEVEGGGELQLQVDGASLATVPLDGAGCRSRGLPAERCLSASLPAPLRASAGYVAELAQPVHDATGAELPLPALAFRTGRTTSEPALSVTRCRAGELALAGACLRLGGPELRARLTCASPVSACLVGCGAQACGVSALSELTLTLARSELGPCPAVLRLVDGARQQRDVAISVPAAPGGPHLTISELRLPASGEGSAHAYVELLNFGVAPESLRGATLLRDTETHGVTIDEPIPVGPGERVLVVSDDFTLADPDRAEADAGAAGALPTGVRIVRLARSLALAPSGTALTLLDAAGAFVSGAPAVATPFAGACLVRDEADPNALRGDARGFFALRASSGCSPGRAAP